MIDQYFAVFLVNDPKEHYDAVSEVITSLVTLNDRVSRYSEGDGLPGGIIIVKMYRSNPSDEDLLSFASQISDTISMEAMVHVLVGFDRCVSGEDDIKLALKHARTAVDIGLTFKLRRQILPYFNLGLSKLVYSLPKDVIEEYHSDNLENFSFSDLDSETLSTIYALFDNGLSLAKTAKQLYIHRNTLNYRINKFQKLSGLNLRDFDDAVICQIAMLIERL